MRHTVEDEPHFCIRTLAAVFGGGRELGRHAHAWGQLITAASGVMTVWTEAGSWVAPPHWAIWVPDGVRHAIRFTGETTLLTLYVRPGWGRDPPAGCQVVAAGPLLRALIQRATEIGMLDERDPIHRSVARLILEELTVRKTAPFELPAPASDDARRAAELMTRGEDPDSTAELARRVGTSTRTLERRFLAETGLTLAAWRRQARLQGALRDLASGRPVKQAAATAGYATPSAFVSAFRSAFGASPGRYFAPEG
jgi:AraC-like DNA-binding protein